MTTIPPNCVVVVPLYKNQLTANEFQSLVQCDNTLNSHDKTFIAPEGLDISLITKQFPSFQITLFQQHWFLSPDTYSRLLLTKSFYEIFIRYSHLLIYQLDAFVFRDSLLDWCSQDYDYVGAPWLGKNWPNTFLGHINQRLTSPPLFRLLSWKMLIQRRLLTKKHNLVGNGGLSLRRVNSAIDTLDSLAHYAMQWSWNEDTFWGIFAPNRRRQYKVPPANIAASFALELEPRLGFEMNNQTLPFGCHAWWSIDPTFWRPYFERQGHSIIT